MPTACHAPLEPRGLLAADATACFTRKRERERERESQTEREGKRGREGGRVGEREE